MGTLTAEDLPFKILGRSKERLYHFLAEDTGTVISLTPPQFVKKNFFDLAPRKFWIDNFPVMRYDKQSDIYISTNQIDEDKASDFIMQESKKIKYSIKNYRSGGFWKDDNRIIYNPGHGNVYELIEDENNRTDIKKSRYKDFDSEYYYMVSDRNFPLPLEKTPDNLATNEDGKKLEKLFYAQSFKTKFEAKFLMGWSLLAPFGTILDWRPHVWISGQKERGKSWLFESIIGPLGCGSEFVTGSGASFAALRRSLGENGGYAIIDEVDGRNKKIREKVDELMELVKNATSNSSGISHLVINGKTETFCVNQMFCLVAIVPRMEGQALKSRVFNCELNNKVTMPEKIKQTNKILKDGFFDNKEKFFNRTFYSLFRILKTSEIIHNAIKKATMEVRKADLIAPCLAAYWHSITTEVITENEAVDLVIEYQSYLGRQEKEEQDYDTFFRVLFNSVIRVLNNEDKYVEKSVANLILHPGIGSNSMALENIGIKVDGMVTVPKDNDSDEDIHATGELLISSRSDHISKLMTDAGTYFGNEYQKSIKEHPASIGAKSYRIGHTVYCRVFDLKKIAEMYFSAGEKVVDDLEF
jgi:hypothetical protein